MQLSGAEIGLLQKAILDGYPMADFLRDELIVLERPFDHIVNSNAPYPGQVVDVIVHAQSNNWLPKLIEVVRARNPANPHMQQLDAAIKPALALAVDDPYGACYLWGAIPFANRRPFRDALRQLKTGERVVLVVNGETKSGKTHSYQLVAFAAEEDNAFKAVLINLNNTIIPARDPADVAAAILWAIDPQIEPPEPPRTDRQLGNMCRQMAGYLARLNTPLWVAIDGLSQTTVPIMTQQMVMWMINEVQSANIRNLRLILLGYTEPIVGVQRIAHEMIKSPVMEELKTLLQEAARLRNLAVAEANLAQHATMISQKLAQQPGRGLEPLGEELERTLATLAAPN